MAFESMDDRTHYNAHRMASLSLDRVTMLAGLLLWNTSVRRTLESMDDRTHQDPGWSASVENQTRS